MRKRSRILGMNDFLVRMPPSPTGKLHLGTARTGLMNWLFAKKNGGDMIFRWEDTDTERSKAEFEEEILEGLAWLGMDFKKESIGFYRQTEWTKKHQEALEKLWKKGKIFPCFCLKDWIEEQKEEARQKKQNFVFFSPCRDLPRTEVEERMKNESFVWRILCPKGEDIVFEDAVRGNITVKSDILGDFVVARADGRVLYALANVVDDHLQGVTHVIRGEDHISNTPKQILLYNAIGVTSPVFGHIPLVLDSQKKKLSKRNVDANTAVLIADFRRMGFLPQAVINGLVYLGWTPKDSEKELYSLEELEKVFDFSRVQKGAAQYDMKKMLWLNKKWLNTISAEELVVAYKKWATENQQTEYVHEKDEDLAQILPIFVQKCETLADLHASLAPVFTDPLFDAENIPDVEKAVEMLPKIIDFVEKLPEVQCFEEIRTLTKAFLKENNVKTRDFLPAWRIALTNATPSASPFEMSFAIGTQNAVFRLKRALDVLSVK